MDHLKATKAKTMDVSVLLDQEKAYDRVNSMYLEKVLLHFRFPRTLVTVIIHLFYNTQISLSINGWLGTPFFQQRGLRQGDPLSPLLFNLAFEPLLRHILASDTIPGLSLPYVSLSSTQLPLPDNPSIGNAYSSQPMKILAYADDLAVFLSSPDEWTALIAIMELYGRASNAKINIEKTVVISLSGATHRAWTRLLTAASDQIQWHDAQCQNAVRYLGYPLYTSD
jgi:hypothetical protein